MNIEAIPELQGEEVVNHFIMADNSVRKRSPKILHNQGDCLNRVANFILEDSYMHPHLHPSDEKIEKMFLIQGSFALLIFNNDGEITCVTVLEKGVCEFVEVPAFTWHTYVMLSNKVIVYETMEGVYEPDSWKKMAPWAPAENTIDAAPYLELLKTKVNL